MCVCVCVLERYSERKKERGIVRERGRETEEQRLERERGRKQRIIYFDTKSRMFTIVLIAIFYHGTGDWSSLNLVALYAGLSTKRDL